ncbi:sex-determining region Y protein-like [Menidia menidia]
MQTVQNKNGHIKRPMNAFFVWACLHRRSVQQAFPWTESKDVSFHLGCVWSKLTEEQKRPYYEAAHKLRDMHRQQFPDYEYRPRRRKCREPVGWAQRAEQQGSSVPVYGQQAVPAAQSSLMGVNINLRPMSVPHTVGHCPPSCSHTAHVADPCSMPHIHSSRFLCRSPFVSSYSEGLSNHCHAHQQARAFALGAFGRKMCYSQDCLVGSTSFRNF